MERRWQQDLSPRRIQLRSDDMPMAGTISIPSHLMRAQFGCKCHWRGIFSICDPPRQSSWRSLRHIGTPTTLLRLRSLPGCCGGHRRELRSFAKSSFRVTALCSPCLFAFQSISCTLQGQLRGPWPAAWTCGGVDLSGVSNVSYTFFG